MIRRIVFSARICKIFRRLTFFIAIDQAKLKIVTPDVVLRTRSMTSRGPLQALAYWLSTYGPPIKSGVTILWLVMVDLIFW